MRQRLINKTEPQETASLQDSKIMGRSAAVVAKRFHYILII
jgi:hypothetical protein